MTEETPQLGATGSRKSKEYLRPMPSTWWLRRKSYFLFMVRDLTCVAVGGYAALLLVLAASAHDQDSFHSVFLWLSTSRWSVALHAIALPLVLYHTITWFDLTSRAVVIWRGEERVSPVLIAGSNYVAWLVVSVLIAWIVLG